jgi:hypothetical protein
MGPLYAGISMTLQIGKWLLDETSWVPKLVVDLERRPDVL